MAGKIVDDFRVKRVLAAVDGSDFSKKAANIAIQLCKSFSSILVVLSVLEFPGPVEMQEPAMSKTIERVLEDYSRHARSAITPFVSDLVSRARNEGVDASYEILEPQPSVVEGIAEYARAHNIDLIVLGNRGLKGFHKLLTGSVSSGVVNHAHCCVLVVR